MGVSSQVCFRFLRIGNHGGYGNLVVNVPCCQLKFVAEHIVSISANGRLSIPGNFNPPRSKCFAAITGLINRLFRRPSPCDQVPLSGSQLLLFILCEPRTGKAEWERTLFTEVDADSHAGCCGQRDKYRPIGVCDGKAPIRPSDAV